LREIKIPSCPNLLRQIYSYCVVFCFVPLSEYLRGVRKETWVGEGV